MAESSNVLQQVIQQAKARAGQPLNVKRYRTLQRMAGILAPVIAVSLAVWVWNSASWLDLCDEVIALGGGCVQPPAGLRAGLFIVAVVGSVIGLVLVAYLGRFARIGRMWPFSGWVGLAFITATLTWLALYIAAWLS